MAIDEFHNSLSTQILKQSKEVEALDIDISNTVQLLEETEKTLYLENTLISQEQYALIYAAEGRLDWDKIRGQKILTQELNPSYLTLLERITELEIERSSLLRAITQATKHIEELNLMKEAFAQTGENYSGENSFKSISSLVTVFSYPENGQRVGPRVYINLALGLALGLMLGAFVTFIKAYWEDAN